MSITTYIKSGATLNGSKGLLPISLFPRVNHIYPIIA